MRDGAAVIAAVLLALLAIAVPVRALDPYSVNPAGTDALANGKVIIRGAADRASLNMAPLEDDPNPAEGRAVYVVFTDSRKQLCTQPSGTPFCVDLEPAP